MGETPQEGVTPMPYPYPPPGPRPWTTYAGKPLTGWGAPPPGWAAGPFPMTPEPWYAPVAWQPYEHHVPDPLVATWTAIIEPALENVLPAIHGLLQISGQLLGQLPTVLDIPGPETAEVTAEDAPIPSFGLGHVGLFGAADAGSPDPGNPELGNPDGRA